MKMSAAGFLLEISRRSRGVSPSRDVLADVRRFLELRGETAEGQLVRKVLSTLITTEGNFVDSEIWLLSAESCALLAALADARTEGRYSEDEWRLST